MRGLFITLEGGEGTGKSTQARRLRAHLVEKGLQVCTTREPGGTLEAEALRSLVVNGTADSWSVVGEALLMNAARDSHLRQVIRPALSRGEVVICDRFMDSTRVYQGHAGGCDIELLMKLERAVVMDTVPDLTLVFDLDPIVGLARASKRLQNHEARFEGKGLSFHQKLREGFLAVAEAEPKRCQIVLANQTEDRVFFDIVSIVEPYLG